MAWAGAAAALLLVVGVVIAIVVNNKKEDEGGTPAAGPTNSATPNSGPFTGVFRAEFGPPSTNGRPDQTSTATSGQFSVRSACRSSICVATANATGGSVLQKPFVFDQINGEWLAVATTSVTSAPSSASGLSTCKYPGEYWTVITLRPQSDGTLTGRYRAMAAAHCDSERTITLTRTGDVAAGSLPDPAGQASRVTSPANGLHGAYHGTRTPDDNRKAVTWDTRIETYCLRTGERCASYLHDEGYDVVVFAGGKWTLSYEGTHNCSDGGTEQLKYHWEFPLPQPAQDPITLLTGRGPREIIGTGCSGSFNENVKYERTGD
jgi:serine/threonine-protein kinase